MRQETFWINFRLWSDIKKVYCLWWARNLLKFPLALDFRMGFLFRSRAVFFYQFRSFVLFMPRSCTPKSSLQKRWQLLIKSKFLNQQCQLFGQFGSELSGCNSINRFPEISCSTMSGPRVCNEKLFVWKCFEDLRCGSFALISAF